MEIVKVDVNEIKKDLYRTKAIAKLQYYEPSKGDLIYMVEALGKLWSFPIHTVETEILEREVMDSGVRVRIQMEGTRLTQDLAGARFLPEIKGASLIRWIQQAIEKYEFNCD